MFITTNSAQAACDFSDSFQWSNNGIAKPTDKRRVCQILQQLVCMRVISWHTNDATCYIIWQGINTTMPEPSKLNA